MACNCPKVAMPISLPTHHGCGGLLGPRFVPVTATPNHFFFSQRTYRAMYDYSAQDEDEVSFRDGDYIVNVQPIDDGWMYGTVQRTGRTGMLPANYIEFVN